MSDSDDFISNFIDERVLPGKTAGSENVNSNFTNIFIDSAHLSENFQDVDDNHQNFDTSKFNVKIFETDQEESLKNYGSTCLQNLGLSYDKLLKNLYNIIDSTVEKIYEFSVASKSASSNANTGSASRRTRRSSGINIEQQNKPKQPDFYLLDFEPSTGTISLYKSTEFYYDIESKCQRQRVDGCEYFLGWWISQ